MERKRAIDLFSGVGGMTLALEPWFETTLFCDINPFCRGVLTSRFPNVPIHEDITTLVDSLIVDSEGSVSYHSTVLGKIDLICGGFPCQDISCNKINARGIEGERSGLFYTAMEVVKKIRPSYVLLENVPAIRTRGLSEVLRAFADAKYNCKWRMLSAHEVGAPHNRKRWFCLATRNDTSLPVLWKEGDDIIRKQWLTDEPPIYSPTPQNAIQKKIAECYGNAVCPKQCRSAFLWLCASSSPLSKERTTNDLPANGVMECDSFRILEIDIPLLQRSELLYPTPTRVPRPSEGSCRIARRLFLSKKVKFLDAAALCGRCPHLAKSNIAEHEPVSDFDADPAHTTSCTKSFALFRNVDWMEWLMGFPEGWIATTLKK